ncbi:helix-turn-helix transcriptional regulator [Metabacillus idriensis]|uniref:helix-turn-helix domain-containing protein n=1 Tax=Metabacillus idriensis TaxID=324768 RepID=UPI0028140F71|nr:helix-turn-helix transcriptional regulator [Metabacillus idriensis]MDR0139311.1 helix-turn-helix transcriptional regulator [Metabacillus idriensis]
MIGERVKRLRQEKDLSISELAAITGVAKSYISSIERNIKSNPSIHILEKIAEGLDVPLLTILSENKTAENIDSEWLFLLKKAIDTGLTKDQFEEFITIRMLKK